MVIVEKEGNLKYNRVKCNNCGSILKYLDSDEKEKFNLDGYFGAEARYYITCPVCGKNVITLAICENAKIDYRIK